MSVRLVLVPALLSVLPGCGVVQGAEPAPHPDVKAAGAEVRLVERSRADLVLSISNQSFEDGRVRLTVAVDGVIVVDDDFHVEDQHNWTSFPLALSPGDHEVTAEADSGAVLRESFEVRSDQTCYAAIDHWGGDETAELTWLFRRQPIAFA